MSKTSIWCDLIWMLSSVELVKTISLQEIEKMFICITPWQNNHAAYSVGHESFILTRNQIGITLIKTDRQTAKL